MQFNARARNICFSPFKLRPLADVIRGKDVRYALSWLATSSLKRAVPLAKAVASAAANAKHRNNVEMDQLKIKEIRIDHGHAFRYFKPGAMGRANMYKRRFSHINVTVESVDNERG
jgi:large subunit ribosomal protein L22